MRRIYYRIGYLFSLPILLLIILFVLFTRRPNMTSLTEREAFFNTIRYICIGNIHLLMVLGWLTFSAFAYWFINIKLF